MKLDSIIDFIFELNQLKRQKHSGWALAGVKDADTIAEHSWRAAQIGFILAVLEGVDPYKVLGMLVVHDNAEARIGDIHKVTARYLDTKKAEQQAFFEQCEVLPPKVAKEFQSLFQQCEDRHTKEGVVAKDADWVEMAFQAREYEELGYKTQDWLKNIEQALETTSAKKIVKALQRKSFCDWWKGLKKMTYTKLKK